jgi:hypothetical protein
MVLEAVGAAGFGRAVQIQQRRRALLRRAVQHKPYQPDKRNRFHFPYRPPP